MRRELGFVLGLVVLGCSAGKEESSPTGTLDGSSGDVAFDVDLNVDGLTPPDGTVDRPATLEGKVVAPEGTIPISGALVYTTTTPPSAIPDKTYCDKCVKLADGTPYTTTKPDGTFSLPTFLGEQYVVVQKGAFRRVRSYKVVEGKQTLPKELTTLPPKTDKAKGDDVPKIAVAVGAWDPIPVVLAKLGLEAKITKGGFLGAQTRVLAKDAVGFTIYGAQDLGETPAPPSQTKLLTDPAEIGKYHVVFVPCTGGTNDTGEPKCTGVWSGGAAKTTLDGFVKAGGRLYASDWGYEYIRQPFPGYISWQGESATIGSACSGGGGDQAAKVEDTGLADWLAAQGKTLDTVKDAWTYLTKVNPMPDTDPDGKPVTSTPKVWVSAGGKPATVSFEHACGRVLFTTYHTQPTSEVTAPLEPQALALLYLILEVNVCVGPPVIK